jgi:hypothetical protein
MARKQENGEIVARWKGFGGPLLYANPYGPCGQIVAKASTGDEKILVHDLLPDQTLALTGSSCLGLSRVDDRSGANGAAAAENPPGLRQAPRHARRW